MALEAMAEEYFKTMSPLASKVFEDVEDAKLAYENIWDTLTEKEQVEIINESLIKPEISLKYAVLDTLEFDLNDTPVRKDDLMSFFGRDHGLRLIQDENTSYRDEHSAPFLYQTKSQLNLCVLSEYRERIDVGANSPQPVLTELAMSHSKVVCELKNALKSHDVFKSAAFKDKTECLEKEVLSSPTGFISKLIGSKFKNKEEDKERLVSPGVAQIVTSPATLRPNYNNSDRLEREYRSGVVKSNSEVSEEQRGLLCSISQGSSTAECEDLEQKTGSTTSSLPMTGYDFLDNW